MRRWIRPLVLVAATGMLEGTSGRWAVLLVRLRPLTPGSTAEEEAAPLPGTLALEWPAVVWAPTSTVQTGMTAEVWMAPRLSVPTTVWPGIDRRASFCPRLPLASHPGKANGVEALSFSRALRRGTT